MRGRGSLTAIIPYTDYRIALIETLLAGGVKKTGELITGGDAVDGSRLLARERTNGAYDSIRHRAPFVKSCFSKRDTSMRPSCSLSIVPFSNRTLLEPGVGPSSSALTG